VPVDPRFPDRPDHPFFWEMSLAVIDNDTVIEQGKRFEDALEALGIHRRSLAYMADQRVARFFAGNPGAHPRAVSTATWVDGFSAAMRLMQNRLPKDGQHRG
jgi:hypothetical protein